MKCKSCWRELREEEQEWGVCVSCENEKWDAEMERLEDKLDSVWEENGFSDESDYWNYKER